MNQSRRRFLLGATAVVGASATPLWARWICDQMQRLQPKPRVEIVRIETGLRPIQGQPGLYRDAQTGRIVSIRDWVDAPLQSSEMPLLIHNYLHGVLRSTTQ